MEQFESGAREDVEVAADQSQITGLLAAAAVAFRMEQNAESDIEIKASAGLSDQRESVEPQAAPGETMFDAAFETKTSRLIPEADSAGAFPSAPVIPGEFTLAANCLHAGKLHLHRRYDFERGVGHGLLHAALNPEKLAPLVVMKAGNGWHVVDGWARLEAIRIQHGDDTESQVRVVEWTGTEKDALLVRFDQTFLKLGSKKIELAHQLSQLSQLWDVPQVVLSARIGWTESKVTKNLTAARLDAKHPGFKQLLERSYDPPIDYLYKIGAALEKAVEQDAGHPRRSHEKGAVAALLNRLDKLLSTKTLLPPAEALLALGVAEKPADPKLPLDQPPASPTAAEFSEPELIDPVMGHDDQVVGALEMHPDGQHRILLPSNIEALNRMEREAARTAFHALIDKLFA